MLPRDSVAQEKMPGNRNKNVGAGRNRKHEREVGPAQQRQIADHPNGQGASAGKHPGIQQRANVIKRIGRNRPAYLLHPPAEAHVSHHICDYYDSCQ